MNPDVPHTIGVEHGRKRVHMEASGVMIYNITRRSTYDRVRSWLTDARRFTSNCAVILIGSKSDLGGQRDVPYEEAKEFADENGS